MHGPQPTWRVLHAFHTFNDSPCIAPRWALYCLPRYALFCPHIETLHIERRDTMMMQSLRAPGARLPQQHVTRSAAAQAPFRMALGCQQGRMRVVSLAEQVKIDAGTEMDAVMETKMTALLQKFKTFDSDGCANGRKKQEPAVALAGSAWGEGVENPPIIS
jgi:hypothetical protein